MIILYPQAIPDDTEETIWYGGELDNPNGCWDWVGWYGTNADQIGGALNIYYAIVTTGSLLLIPANLHIFRCPNGCYHQHDQQDC